MSGRQKKKEKTMVKVRRMKMNVGKVQWKKVDTDLEPPFVNNYLSSLRICGWPPKITLISFRKL